MSIITSPLAILGWREWVALPDFGIEQIKAKIDSGARSSALHAYQIEPYYKGSQNWIMFAIHPKQKNRTISVECHAPVKDRRMVSDSGGHRQRRYVIETDVMIGQVRLRTELTLTNRDTMLFRMLIGRTAINHRFVIDPSTSYLQGKPKR